MNEEPFAVTFLVIEALENLSIPYFIGGSLASSLYGVARSTLDADIVADVRQEHAQSLCDLLGETFNIEKEAIEQALKHRTSFNLIHYDSLFKVDVFIPKGRLFDRQQFQHRALHVTPQNQQSAYFASPEDTILAKLEWYRQGGEVSDQQWRDVTSIFKSKHNELDVDYMESMAAELNVSDLLQRLL